MCVVVRRLLVSFLVVCSYFLSIASVSAAPIGIEIRLENRSPLNSLRLGVSSFTFHDNSGFDLFDFFGSITGETTDCSAGILDAASCVILVGDQMPGLIAASHIADSGIVGTTLSNIIGLAPGASEVKTLSVDPSATHLSFLGSVTPSNDAFIGTDEAFDIASLFTDPIGTQMVFSFSLFDIFDAGFEGDSLTGAKGLLNVGSEIIDFGEDGFISQGFFNYSIFDGAILNDGTVFDGFGLGSGPEVFRITLTSVAQAVPEPASLGILGFGLVSFGLLRRRKRTICDHFNLVEAR